MEIVSLRKLNNTIWKLISLSDGSISGNRSYWKLMSLDRENVDGACRLTARQSARAESNWKLETRHRPGKQRQAKTIIGKTVTVTQKKKI